jgi:hypothetical protein
MTCKGTLRQVFICLRPPPTKYSHIQSTKQCLASSELLNPHLLSSPPSECVLVPLHQRRGQGWAKLVFKA